MPLWCLANYCRGLQCFLEARYFQHYFLCNIFDSIIPGTFLAFENNRPFSTKDVDNDADSTRHCATVRSAWWYSSCFKSDLNAAYMTGAGPTNRGIIWRDFEANEYSIKRTEMKIRPVDHGQWIGRGSGVTRGGQGFGAKNGMDGEDDGERERKKKKRKKRR